MILLSYECFIMSERKLRITLALSPETVEQCDKLAKKMGLSRSAFVEFFMSTTFPYVPMIEDMLADISSSVTKDMIKKTKDLEAESDSEDEDDDDESVSGKITKGFAIPLEKEAVPLEGKYTKKE